MSWKDKMPHLAVCIIAICLASVTHVESKKSHKVSVIPNHCGETFNQTTGKVENKNFTLGKICEFNIIPLYANGTPIAEPVYLFFETLQLHKDDSLTITEPKNDTEPLFEPFSFISGSLLLITSKPNLTLHLNITSVDVPREITASYLSGPSCSFTPGPEVHVFTKPVYEKDAAGVTPCSYVFTHDQHKNASFAFIFEKFNLSSGSFVKTENLEPTRNRLSGADVPPDMFAQEDNAKVEMNFDPKTPDDVFIMRKQRLIQECSFYKGINGKELFKSPKLSVIPEGVQSECRWSIENKNNRALGVQFTSLNLGKLDVVAVVDNGHSVAPPFMQVTSLGQTEALASQIRTSGSRIIISFKAESFLSANVSMTVFDAGSGKYMKNNGSFEANPSPGGDVNATVFLLDVDQGENVLLNFKKWDIRPPAQLEIHDDFHAQSKKIAVLTSNVWYPLLSTTSRVMIHAVNFKDGSFGGVFKGTAAGCNHMSPGESDSYVLLGNCNSSCSWIIPPVNSKSELQLDLQYMALEKSDVINIFRLDSNKTLVANITYGTTRVPMFTLDSKVGALVEVTRKECSQPTDIILVAQATYLPACSRNVTLGPYEMLQLKSPNYPDTYPLLAVCKSGITRKSEKQMLYLSFDKLQLAPDHCIQISVTTKNGSSSFPVSGNVMPDDMLYYGDASVTFNSGNCNATKNVEKSNAYASAEGFVMNVTSTDCGGLFEKNSGTLESVANKSLCIWKVSVTPHGGDGSVNVLIFNVTAKGETGNYKLTVYDGASMRENQLANYTDPNTWSRTNALIFVYEVVDRTKPSSPVTISYITHNCDTKMQCNNKLCMHPDWRCNGKNDCGDFTDEKDCGSVPVPPVDNVKKGISAVVFGVCCVIFFILGIVMTVFLPKVAEKFRNSRYHQFRDVSVVE